MRTTRLVHLVAAIAVIAGLFVVDVGATAPVASATAAGSKLAGAEINAAGGINGRKLKVLYEDDGYVPARSVSAMRKLVDVDKVFAVTGTTGGSGVTAVLPVLDDAKVPTIVHVAPNPTVLNPRRPSIFMIGPDYDLAAYQSIRHAAQTPRTPTSAATAPRSSPSPGSNRATR